MNRVALKQDDNAAGGVLYMALELSKAKRKVGFTDGHKRRVVNVPGGEVAGLWAAVAEAKRLATDLQGEPVRAGERPGLLERQIGALEAERERRVREAGDAHGPLAMVRRLRQLKGIGPVAARVFVMAFFGWRGFRNGREVGALAGLTGSAYSSGATQREQGISKAGNRRGRSLAVEIAWLWLRYHPDSALSRWFQARFAGAGKRHRRVGIVALARKLLVALWRYLEHGVVPAGARLKAPG